MSIASQQRVIQEHQATIRQLRQQLAQAKADRRDALSVYEHLTETCDNYVVAGRREVPISVLRQIRREGRTWGGRAPRDRTKELAGNLVQRADELLEESR